MTPVRDFRGWLPVRTFFRAGKAFVDWAYFGTMRLSEPFFRDSVAIAMRLPFNQAFRRVTAADELADLTSPELGNMPTALIFHASRCGSTLISQMLAALPSHVVVSEPPMLDAILRAAHAGEALTERHQVAYIRALIMALGQARAGETEYVVKLDAWDIFDLSLIRQAFPDTPWIYLYRDPLEIAVSQLRQRGSYMVPGVLGPAQILINPDEAMAMSEDEYIARILGRMFQRGTEAVASAGGRAVHYSQLPVAMWTDLAVTFGVANEPGCVERMQQAAQWDAKNPYFAFTGDSDGKQREATPRLRELIDQWATPHYIELERLRLDGAHRAQ